jgi:NADH-quinone oxidoreductase subunit E
MSDNRASQGATAGIEVFSFTEENLIKAKTILEKYPEERKQSASLPLLDLAQRQNNGWLSVACIEYVASMISMPYMRLYEVASFYTMFNLKPVGKYHIQVCGTTPCWLNGAAEIKSICEGLTGSKTGHGCSEDGLFSISEVECLGACVNAPIVQINDDYYENLDEAKISDLINRLKSAD